MDSIYIRKLHDDTLETLAIKSLKQLIQSPIDSMDGISLTTECPYGTICLNTIRPAVLRQYYGENVHSIPSLSEEVSRYTYGYSMRNQSVGTDPSQFVTKPFNKYLRRMSTYITSLLHNLPTDMLNSDIDISHRFNHCVKLLYISKDNIKLESSLGYHCDVSYSNKGTYQTLQNSQIENTPTVIFSFGDDRVLRWRRKKLMLQKNGYKAWVTDKEWNDCIQMNDCSLTVINTIGECPQYCTELETMVKYQHGVAKVETNHFSIGYVFRPVNSVKNYYISTNKMVCPKENYKSEEENELLKMFDKEKYHKNLIQFCKDKI